MTPTDLQLVQGDATSIPEETAFAAYQTLREARTNPELAASPALATSREALKSYVTERRRHGHDLFPNVTTAANRERNDSLAGLYTKPLEKALPQQAFADLTRKMEYVPDPEAFKMREINRTFLSATVGQAIPPEKYDTIRTIYAKQHLGLDKDTSEAAVFTAIKTRFDEELGSTEKIREIAKGEFESILGGTLPTTLPDLSAIPERLRPQVSDQILATRRQSKERIRQAMPAVREIMPALQAEAARLASGQMQGLPHLALMDRMAAALPRDPVKKEIAIALIAREMQKLPEQEKGAFARILTSIERGGDNAAISAIRAPMEAGAAIRDMIPAGAEQKRTAADNLTIRTDAENLRKAFLGEVDPLRRAGDNIAVQSLVLAGESAWTIPATLSGPIGWGAMASSFAGNSFQEARTINPDASAGAQIGAAAASGVAQAGAEVVLNKVGFKIIGGKLPGLAGILNKSGVFNPAARATIAGATGAVSIGATEYAEEAVQGGIDRLAQDLALEFSNIAPDTDWKGFWGDWLTVGKAEQKDTLLAVLPFAVVGAGGASFQHFRYGSQLAKNRTVLDAIGVPSSVVDEMVNTTDVKKTDELFRQAWETGLEERTQEQKAAALDVMREINSLTAAAGLDRITRDSEFTYTYTDPLTRDSQEFETEEEALLHWRQQALSASQTDLDTIALTSREDLLNFLTSEGKASEETMIDEQERTLTLPQAVKEGIANPEQIESRVRIFILQNGLTPAQAAKEVESLTIRARSYTQQSRDGQYRYAVQLFKNADPLDVFEDFAEDSIKRAFDDSLADPRRILRDIRTYEGASNTRLIAQDYEYDPDNTLPLVEGFSALARALVIGNARADLLPPAVSQWIEVAATYGANTIDLARSAITADLTRAGELKKALASGNVPTELVSRLEDAIGINETEVLARLEKKHRDQLAAEAMGGFPEIRDNLEGRMPHPETLRKNQHPLAGEVRRIWESMKKPTRRKDRSGRTIDRSNEANAFFLPVGQMVDIDKLREAMNEKGFDFDTPADMLDALESSISYNKPVYGTGSRGNDSFSIGTTYPRFNLRPDGATLYVHSNTGVLFPDGHEIKTLPAVPDTLSDGRGAFWDGIRNGGRRDAILRAWRKKGTDQRNADWLVKALSKADGWKNSGTVAETWQWLANSLNSMTIDQGWEVENIIETLPELLDLPGAVWEGIREKDYAYIPISPDGTVLYTPVREQKFAFGRLPTTAEVADAQAAHDANPQIYPSFSIGKDRSHLAALELSLSRERVRLQQSKTDGEKRQREVWVAQIVREISDERAFLGIAEPEPDQEMSDEDLLAQLMGESFSIGRATVTPTTSTQTFPTKDGDSFSIGASPAPFYSQLERVIEDKLPKAATFAQIMATIDPAKGSGVKAEEIKWSGIESEVFRLALDNDKVKKSDLLAYLAAAGRVEFAEVTMSDPQRKGAVYDWAVSNGEENTYFRSYQEAAEYADQQGINITEDTVFQATNRRRDSTNPKYEQYTLPGGENYRETVLRLPQKGTSYTEENVVAIDPAAPIAGRPDLFWYFEVPGNVLQIPKSNHPTQAEAKTYILRDKQPEEPNSYTSSHFPEISNYVAHMRLNEREDSQGAPGLFIEEIQSDRHQAGRKKGYALGRPNENDIELNFIKSVVPEGQDPSNYPGYWESFDKRTGEMITRHPGRSTREQAMREAQGFGEGMDSERIADAPFRTTWPLAMFKRALREAVESGKDWIGWTVGETQNDRFDLSKQVRHIDWRVSSESNREAVKIDVGVATLQGGDAQDLNKEALTYSEIADFVGKEIADRIKTQVDSFKSKGRLEGDGLKVGGSGMKGFYDNMLPKEVSKYVKKWGGKVESSTIGQSIASEEIDMGELDNATPEELAQLEADGTIQGKAVPIHRVTITPQMRESVAAGQPSFSIGTRRVMPTNYPKSAREIISTTNVKGITHALLKPGEQLVILDEEAEKPMMVSPAYKAAKREGDKRAAWDIARLFLTGKRVAPYKAAIGDRSPVFVPIRQEEGAKQNLLPIAAAWALQQQLGGRVANTVLQLKKGGLTGADNNERSKKDHDFEGALEIQPGETVVLIDDTFTSGSTLTSLYDHLSAQGIEAEHIFSIASGRYTKNIAATTEQITRALDKVGMSEEEFQRATGIPIQAFTGAELAAYSLNGARGIEGFALRFDVKGNTGSGSMVPGADAGLDTSLSLGPAAFARLEQAIAAKMTAAPDERAEYYSRVRDRTAATQQRLEDMDNGIGVFARLPTDEAGEERRRIQDAIAEARAIIGALPPDARGRVEMDFEDITSKTTEKGRVKALIRLMDKADIALEKVLQSAYLESITRVLDLAQPDLRQNRSVRGRLTPETQRLINAILPLTRLTPIEASAEQIAAQASFDALDNQFPDPEDDAAVDAWERSLAAAQERLDLIDTFASLSTQTSAELAAARKHLLQIYTKGRTARQMLDQAKRSETASERREVIESLGGLPSQSKWKKRVDDKGFLDRMEGYRLGLVSFHEMMEWMFPNSIAARDYQKRIRDSERSVTRARIDARQRWENFAFTALNLTGRSRKRRLNQIIATLSTARDDWNIEIAEGRRSESVKMSEEQAASILDGTLKPGWEKDLIAMESLRQALADFRLKRKAAQDQDKAFQGKVIRFERVTQRGAPTFLRMSDMEAVYFLQLAAQSQYLPALDKYGFTEKALNQIRAKIDPRALTIMSHLRGEYDMQYQRLNPVHQRLFGLDMPQIRNYAPGAFESMDGKQDPNISPDGTGGALSAMSAGFTKARTHHMARPRQANALALYWSSLEQTEHFIAWAEVMRDMRQIFRSPDVRRTLEAAYGSRAGAEFSTWLDILETDGRSRAAESLSLTQTFNQILTAQSAIGLAFNIGTVFKQWSAGIGHFMLMPTGAAVKATYKALTSPKSLRYVWNSEAVQQRITQGISPEDRRLMDAANASPSLAMELLEIGRLPISLADGAFTTLMGAAAYRYQYDEATKNGLTDSQAHASALDHMDMVITRTAQPATTQDKSLAENTARGFGKALFLFKSDPRQKFAIAITAIRLATRGDLKTPEAIRRVFFSWAIYGLMAQIAADMWRAISRDDDDPELWEPKDYIAAMIAGPLAGVPILGAAMESTIRSLVGSKAYTNNANPIDKAASMLFRDGGFSSATINAMSGEDVDLTEILAAATRDAASISQLLAIVSPATAIVPAGLRAVRDVVGIGSNVLGAFSGDTPEDIAARIVREEKEADKKPAENRKQTLDTLAKELAAMPAAQREKRLRQLDADTRTAITSRLRKADMTPSERSLASLPAAARAKAIARILAELPEEDRKPYLDRLESIGLIPD